MHPVFTLHTLSPSSQRGLLIGGGLRLPCSIGKGGKRVFKQEGDGATPFYRMQVRSGFYRADHIRRPLTLLPLKPLNPRDGWCDDPSHRLYNRLIAKPFSSRHETLHRDDALYDIVLDLSWNRGPIIRGRGSAIFLHLRREDQGPTEGCIALSLKDMRILLGHLQKGSIINTSSKKRPIAKPRR